MRCLDANKHNHETTCYYLMLGKLQREGLIEPHSQYANVARVQNNPRQDTSPSVSTSKRQKSADLRAS